jgi:excisionase family DNA binding protein
MDDRLLTVEQVSEYLGVHRDTVYAMVRSGRLRALQLGGRKASWRISQSDLLTFVGGRKHGGDSSDGESPEPDSDGDALAEFDRQQSQDLVDFKADQQQQRVDFQAEQARERSSGRGGATV